MVILDGSHGLSGCPGEEAFAFPFPDAEKQQEHEKRDPCTEERRSAQAHCPQHHAAERRGGCPAHGLAAAHEGIDSALFRFRYKVDGHSVHRYILGGGKNVDEDRNGGE